MSALENDKLLVRELLEAWFQERSPCVLPGVPEDMLAEDSSPSCSDWVAWRMLPSTVSEISIREIESALPATLPPFFKAFLSANFVLDLDFGDYCLVDLPCDRPLVEIRQCLLDDFAHAAGFMAFGNARGTGDPLCFDFMEPNEEGDYPIVVFNHDVVPHEAWSERSELLPYAGPVAESFRDFFPRLLSYDSVLFPPPLSPEETRRNAAWDVVAVLLQERGLPRYFRPEGVSHTDPWAIAERLRSLPEAKPPT